MNLEQLETKYNELGAEIKAFKQQQELPYKVGDKVIALWDTNIEGLKKGDIETITRVENADIWVSNTDNSPWPYGESWELYVEPKFTYPLFKRWKIDGEIVKFKSLQSGTTMWQGDGCNGIGYESKTFTSHTDDRWGDVPYDAERDLWHGQFVMCWDDKGMYHRTSTFYDAINKCGFAYNGTLNGFTYDNYEAIKPENYTEWMIEAYKTLDK